MNLFYKIRREIGRRVLDGTGEVNDYVASISEKSQGEVVQDAMLEEVQVAKGSLESTAIRNSRINKLIFTSCQMADLFIDGCSYDAAISGMLTFSQVKGHNIRIINCRNLEIGIEESEISSLKIANCADVTVKINACENISDFEMVACWNSNLEVLNTNVDGMVVENSRGSRCNFVTIRSCNINNWNNELSLLTDKLTFGYNTMTRSSPLVEAEEYILDGNAITECFQGELNIEQGMVQNPFLKAIIEREAIYLASKEKQKNT